MDKEIKQSINRFLFNIVSTLLGIILSGLLLKQLWFWFVASQFGFFELTLIQAIGIDLLVTYMTIGFADTVEGLKERDFNEQKKIKAMNYGQMLIVWLSAFIVHLFM